MTRAKTKTKAKPKNETPPANLLERTVFVLDDPGATWASYQVCEICSSPAEAAAFAAGFNKAGDYNAGHASCSSEGLLKVLPVVSPTRVKPSGPLPAQDQKAGWRGLFK